MPEYDAATLTRGRWRNPVFLLVFVPVAVAWLVVVGWLTWMYFNPVMGWVGRQHEMLQEILTTIIWGGSAVAIVGGLAAIGGFAERVAGIPPGGSSATGQTAGQHAGWTPPKRN